MMQKFFELAAQIIPVIFLAMTIQSSYSLKAAYDEKQSFQRYVHLITYLGWGLLMILTEAMALMYVVTGSAKPLSMWTVGLVMATGALLVLVDYALTILDKRSEGYNIGFLVMSCAGIMGFILLYSFS